MSGEQYECPKCGKATEVYSRITGYYRPVQHWNDGKSQEFSNRVEYKPTLDNLTLKDSDVSSQEEYIHNISEKSQVKKYLFTTKTCPNCHVAKEFLKEEMIEVLDADEHIDLVSKYSIMQAPTLVIVNDDQYNKYTGLSDIKGYTEMIS